MTKLKGTLPSRTKPRAQIKQGSKNRSIFIESIRKHQSEKSLILSKFDKEIRKYRAGKISKEEITSTIPKVRKELSKLDKVIQTDLLGVTKILRKSRRKKAPIKKRRPRKRR